MLLSLFFPISIVSFSISVISQSTEEPEIDEDVNNGRTIATDWIIGFLMMLFSLLCGGAYYRILNVIWGDRELRKMASYRFMFFLGVFDIAQCFPHFITGIFTCLQTVFDPLFAKFLGVIATPCYVGYAVLTIFLSFNRLIQITSPKCDRVLFGGNRWKIWIATAGFFWFLFSAALASPWATIRYIPNWYSWDYNYDLPYSANVQKIEMYIEVGGIFLSATFYIIIVIQLVKTKKKFMISRNYSAEGKVLIQASVITVYCTILNILWHNYQYILPLNLWSYTALNFMWILNSGVYPVIYFIVNKALRGKIGPQRSFTVVGAPSVFQKRKSDHTVTPQSSHGK